MTESLVLSNTYGLDREYFPYLLKQSLYKACKTVLNRSGWEKSGVYPFDCAPVWRVRKLDIKASAVAFASAGPLTLPTKISEPLI